MAQIYPYRHSNMLPNDAHTVVVTDPITYNLMTTPGAFEYMLITMVVAFVGILVWVKYVVPVYHWAMFKFFGKR